MSSGVAPQSRLRVSICIGLMCHCVGEWSSWAKPSGYPWKDLRLSPPLPSENHWLVGVPCELLAPGSSTACHLVGAPWAETSSGSAATRSIVAPAPVTHIM